MSTAGTRTISIFAGAVAITGILANTLIAPVLPDIEQEFSASATQLGAVVALASFPGIFLAPVIGVAADRFGRRAVLLPCLLVFGAGGLAGMVAPSLNWLLAGRLLQGSGAAGLVNLSIVILGDRFSGEAATRAIGRNAAALTVGLAVTPTLGGALGALGGWRLSFLPYAIAFPLAFVTLSALEDDRPESTVPLSHQIRDTVPYLRSFGAIAMIAAGVSAFLLIFGLGLTAMPLHLDREFGLGSAARGVVLGIPALAAVAVSLRIGQLTTRFGVWTLVTAGFVIYALAFTGVGATTVMFFVVLAAVGWGVGEALTVVTLQAYAAQIAPSAQRGTIVAVWVSGVRTGQGAGPLVFGGVISAVGTAAAFLIGAAFSAVVAGILALSRARLTRSRVNRTR